MRLAIPTLAVIAAFTLGAVPAASAATGVQQAASENWPGYVVGGQSASGASQKLKSVSGSWVVPSTDCGSGHGYASFWVGLGGAGQTHALEQAGTESDCSAGGVASYSAWYELVPAAPVTVDMAVRAGDIIFSRVTVDGSAVTVALSDQTTGASFDKTLPMNNPDVSSAEWIAEAPSACGQGATACTPLPLADFGTVQFTHASATSTDGVTGTVSDPDWSTAAVTLNPNAASLGLGGTQFASDAGGAGATPSSLSDSGSAFSVTWGASAGAASDTSGGGAGYPAGGYAYPGGGYSGGGYGDPGSGYAYPGYGYPGYGYPGYGYPGYGYGA